MNEINFKKDLTARIKKICEPGCTAPISSTPVFIQCYNGATDEDYTDCVEICSARRDKAGAAYVQDIWGNQWRISELSNEACETLSVAIIRQRLSERNSSLAIA